MLQQPTLHTQRLILRPFRGEDAEDLGRLLNDERITRNTLNIQFPYDVTIAEKWLSGLLELAEKGTDYSFAITFPDEDRVQGCIGIHKNERHLRAGVGYWIAPTLWNKGYMTEILSVVIDFGFEEWNLMRMEASHFTHNPQSGRVMQKAGMTLEGTQRGYLRKQEVQHDNVLYAITREDWARKTIK